MKRYPEAYLRFLTHFHTTRDYFECHEELEHYWKENPDSPHRIAWVGLIQVAVAMYHERRGNIGGARKMLQSAVRLLEHSDLAALGIDRERFVHRLHDRLKQLNVEPAALYRDLDIPVVDLDLNAYVQTVGGYVPDQSIVDKHLLRDRTAIVAERQAELAKRNGTRSGDQ